MKDKKDAITISGLKGKRGWTDALIRDFLGEPDFTKKNPHYSSSAPMKLYYLEKVEETEKLEDFKIRKEKVEKRRGSAKKAAQKAVQTKKENLLRSVEEMEIHVEELKDAAVIKIACESFNDWKRYKRDYDYEPADPKKSDKTFLDRITVNFIRHELTDYDHSLHVVAGNVGVLEAVWRIKEKIFYAIAKKYPQYIGECSKQLGSKIILNEENNREEKT